MFYGKYCELKQAFLAESYYILAKSVDLTGRCLW